MEGLLILIGIWVLDVVIKRVAANRKRQQQLPPQHRQVDSDEDESQEEAQGYSPPRSLQDLIRQFNEAQRDSSQGTYVPPDPPVEKHRDPNKPLTLRDIAEVVIYLDFVNLEFLMEEFDVDENTAARMLEALQKHRIVGRDMGEGDCDVLVHDMDELENLFNHEKRAEEKPDVDEAQNARKRELERQRELNELEDRAKAARESAAAASGIDYASTEETAVRVRKPAVSTKNIADVRKGFIWAKVLDEPRFKRRWSMQSR